MGRIGWYLFRQVGQATLFVTLVLAAAVWITQMLRYVDYIVDGGAPFSVFLQLILLAVPTFIGLILPIALFIAVLFTYNRLTQDNELQVMRAIGVSPLRLAAPALVMAGFVTLALYVLNGALAPLAQRELALLRTFARSEVSTALLREGVFQPVGDNMTVYVRERRADGTVRGVMVHDGSNPLHPVTVMAESGRLSTDAESPMVVVVNGSRQEFDRTTGRANTLLFDRYTIDLGALRPELSTRESEAREQMLWALPSIARDTANPERARRAWGELHERLAQPLTTPSFVLLALAFLLVGDFNRNGQGGRVMAAVLTAVIVQGLALAGQNLVSKIPSVAPLAYAINLLPGMLALWVLTRPVGLALTLPHWLFGARRSA
jgi:lipopolysaccharide export system permease protein